VIGRLVVSRLCLLLVSAGENIFLGTPESGFSTMPPMKLLTSTLICFPTLALASLLVVGCSDGDQQTGSVSAKDVTIAATPISGSVTAIDLYSLYDSNVILANQKYNGKILHISGRVDKIGIDPWEDKMYVTLEGKVDGNPSYYNVKCYFENQWEGELAKLKSGMTVKIKGECQSDFYGDPAMKWCSLLARYDG
jgi:hypothetical protein